MRNLLKLRQVSLDNPGLIFSVKYRYFLQIAHISSHAVGIGLTIADTPLLFLVDFLIEILKIGRFLPKSARNLAFISKKITAKL